MILKDAQWEGWEGRRPPKKHSHSHQFCFSGRGNANTRHSQNHKHTIWQGFTMEAQVIYLEKLHPLFDQILKRNCDGFPCVLSLVPLMDSSKVLWWMKSLMCENSALHVCLDTKPFHALHIALHSAAASDFLGTALREPALLTVPEPLTQVPT